MNIIGADSEDGSNGGFGGGRSDNGSNSDGGGISIDGGGCINGSVNGYNSRINGSGGGTSGDVLDGHGGNGSRGKSCSSGVMY